MMRLASGELLALACSGSARHALARYRQRWTIETMFGNLKTKGFALEATHLTDPDKLGTLLALLAFAVADVSSQSCANFSQFAASNSQKALSSCFNEPSAFLRHCSACFRYSSVTPDILRSFSRIWSTSCN
jgi:hypothetical protein